jgi:hypothetical protein
MKNKRKYSPSEMITFVEKGATIGLKEVTRRNRKQRIDEFIERTWPEEGKARLPRFILLDPGIREFMDSLHHDHINFRNTYIDMLDWFISFMDSLPDTNDVDDVANLARQFREQQANSGQEVSFTDAVAHVSGGNEQILKRILMTS